MKNIDIRVMVSDSGLKYRAIAAEMGISPEWLSTIMRKELSKENKDQILQAIRKLKGENNDRICESKEGDPR